MGVCKGKRKLNNVVSEMFSLVKGKKKRFRHFFDEIRIKILKASRRGTKALCSCCYKSEIETFFYESAMLEMVEAFWNVVAFLLCVSLSE